MTVTLTNFDPMLKDTFSPDFRDELVFNKKNKFLASLTKSPKYGQGDDFLQPIRYSQSAGTHNTFAKAKLNFTSSLYKRFEVPRAKVYKFAKIENEVIQASADDIGAFAPAIDEIEYCFRGLGDYLEQRLFRSQVGAIGTIKTGTTLGSAVALLTDGSDAHNFVVGQVCQLAYNNAGTPTLRAATELTVASVDVTGKSVTFTGNISGVAGAAIGDWIITTGDLSSAPLGVADWILYDRTYISTTFCNVDRSADPDRLAGIKYNGIGQPLNEALQDGLAKLVNAGADGVLDAWVNPITQSSLFKLMASKEQITQVERKISPTIGFPSFSVQLGATTVRVNTSRNVMESDIWLLSPDTWRLNSAGEYLSFLMKRAGSMITPSHDFDGFECSMGGYLNLSCSAPGLNAIIKVA